MANHAELLKAALAAKAAHLELCRRDVNAFVEYVIRDDQTSQPVKQGPIQIKLHALESKYKQLYLMSMPESGKTVNLVIARTLWELGKNPNLRFGIICQSAAKAQQALKTIAKYIEESAELREVFPHLRRAPDAAWTNQQITVERSTMANDPSVAAFGSLSDITGKRIDRLIVDDLLTHKNTSTKHQRDAVYAFFFSTLPSRLTDGARVIILANAWHPDDLVHRLEAIERAGNPSWHVERIPVLNPDGSPAWPERWPATRIEERRLSIGPLQFAREFLCEARSDGDARFKSSYLETCCSQGRGLHPAAVLEDLICPPLAEIDGYALKMGIREFNKTGAWTLPVYIFTGVDLAVQRHSAADETSIVTIAAYPNGMRQVLHVVSGRWTFDEIIAKIKEVYDNLRPAKIMVENVAAQDYLVQHLGATSDIPIVPHTTGKAKADPDIGIESIAANMAMGKWVFPSLDGTTRGIEDPQISKLAEECLYYTPEKHTGDRLMALWFADMCARQHLNPRSGRVSFIDFKPEKKQPKTDEAMERVLRQRAAAAKLREAIKAEAKLARTRPWLREQA